MRWQADTRLVYLDELPALEARYRAFGRHLAERRTYEWIDGRIFLLQPTRALVPYAEFDVREPA